MNIGKIIETLRSEKNISQKKLAEQIGIKQSTISKWERKNAVPNADNIVMLAKYFNVTADYLLGLEKD
ncbi:MAG: helix-turn-helix transcriptional regulator [Candidatus ainarchaeum sp.]|nr:helix-turn-helix transcriptional regulator [Candidatus ainarchaeum sp.]